MRYTEFEFNFAAYLYLTKSTELHHETKALPHTNCNLVRIFQYSSTNHRYFQFNLINKIIHIYDTRMDLSFGMVDVEILLKLIPSFLFFFSITDNTLILNSIL